MSPNNNSKDTVGELPEVEPPATPSHKHHRTQSSLADLTLLEITLPPAGESTEEGKGYINEVQIDEENAVLPKSHLVLLTDTGNLDSSGDGHRRTPSQVLLSSIGDFDFEVHGKLKVKNWTGKKGYSDFIKDGMEYKKEQDKEVIMLFESPSCSTAESSFHNKTKFRFHDWPPPASTKGKAILGPCRYALMNGASYPVFLKEGAPPAGLVEHWKEAVPGYVESTYVPTIKHEQTVYAYLPVEQLPNHVNNPDTHFHLAGKDAIHLMTQKTTKLLPDTKTVRPCVVKTTHSMGSKGIFVIQDDEDDAEFEQFLEESGNPTFVVTDFVDIARNVACHFFMHPDGETVTWFGSNENKRDENGKFTSDSYLMMDEQADLKKLQLPFVEEVVNYCHGLGFWGFCGVDVLFDSKGIGFLVDINPRVTGSCPALMALQQLKREYGFTVGLFRRSGDIFVMKSVSELLEHVSAYNKEHEGKSRIVLHSMYQPDDKPYVKVNIGVYGTDLENCKEVLNSIAKPNPNKQVA